MKQLNRKIIVLTLATAGSSLIAFQNTRAQVQINLFAGELFKPDNSPMPLNGLLLLIASTTDATFTPPNNTSFTPGSDDRIVASFNLNENNGPATGTTLNTITYTYSGSFNIGDPLELYWFPTLTTSTAPPPTNTSYGAFRTDAMLDGSNISWTAPADSATSYSLNFATVAVGGSNPDSFGVASFTVVPEPSTYVLLGFGLGGLALGATRRRQRQVAA